MHCIEQYKWLLVTYNKYYLSFAVLLLINYNYDCVIINKHTLARARGMHDLIWGSG